ncbi:MAG TPA: aspartate aminotransferase family protein [Gemmataceae bacterium]|nr:aspartate aminotransferase family protein [Gemmataceae bacterium]
MLESQFLAPAGTGQWAYRDAITRAADLLASALPRQPYSGRSPAELAGLFAETPCTPDGVDLSEALAEVRAVIENSVALTHPFTAAHLHCPPLVPALAAEVILTALNQSMDSFDQAPAATVLEQRLVRWLCREAGLPPTADGTMTPGGTISNYTALLLARDAWCQTHLGWRVQERGLPPKAKRFRILCSELAHFSVAKSAAQLGLGTGAVVPVAADADYQMCPRDLARQLSRLKSERLLPIAVVATAGTTDFGSIDPLPAIATLARAAGAWMHVDAAYGGALLFSAQHRDRLAGLELADSITLDFHKLFWQPISCGALLVRDVARFDLMKLNTDYLNPEEHEALGIPDLVTRSVLTTRRFDALKLWMSLRVLGRQQLAAMIDRTLELALLAHTTIARHLRLEPIHEPRLGCVVFRYRPEADADADHLNDMIRHRLFDTGHAVIGHTRVRERSCLKFTFLNPCTTSADVAKLIGLIASQGDELEADAARSLRVAHREQIDSPSG